MVSNLGVDDDERMIFVEMPHDSGYGAFFQTIIIRKQPAIAATRQCNRSGEVAVNAPIDLLPDIAQTRITLLDISGDDGSVVG